MIGEAAEKIKNDAKQWLIKNHTTSPWKHCLRARQTLGGGRPATPAGTSTGLRASRRHPTTGRTRPGESRRWPPDRRGTREKRRRRRSAKNKGASRRGNGCWGVRARGAADRPKRPYGDLYLEDGNTAVTCRRVRNLLSMADLGFARCPRHQVRLVTSSSFNIQPTSCGAACR